MTRMHDITQFAELLAELGLGDARVTPDTKLDKLLAKAVKVARAQREALGEQTLRADRLQHAFNAVAPVVEKAPPDYTHHVQWRAVDAEEGVVIRGDWTPVQEEKQAKAFLAREMAALGRTDLTAQRLVRCNHFEITSVATPDEQAEPY